MHPVSGFTIGGTEVTLTFSNDNLLQLNKFINCLSGAISSHAILQGSTATCISPPIIPSDNTVVDLKIHVDRVSGTRFLLESRA